MTNTSAQPGGSYIHIPPKKHKCQLPATNDPLGTIWRCDQCLTHWRRVEREVGFGTAKTWTTDFRHNLLSGNLTGWWCAEGTTRRKGGDA